MKKCLRDNTVQSPNFPDIKVVNYLRSDCIVVRVRIRTLLKSALKSATFPLLILKLDDSSSSGFKDFSRRFTVSSITYQYHQPPDLSYTLFLHHTSEKGHISRDLA